jgi:hypothetical protein
MEFQSHIVVTSQSMNNKFGPPTPSCFAYKQVNTHGYFPLKYTLDNNDTCSLRFSTSAALGRGGRRPPTGAKAPRLLPCWVLTRTGVRVVANARSGADVTKLFTAVSYRFS